MFKETNYVIFIKKKNLLRKQGNCLKNYTVTFFYMNIIGK